jgi:autotransporter translocation and assembly factor TamB
MMKFGIFKRILITVFSILAGLFALSYFLIATPYGLRTLLWTTQRFIHGKLSFDVVEGSLYYPLQIKQFSYSDDSLEISLDKVQLSWDLFSLFQEKPRVKQFTLQGLRVTKKIPDNTPNVIVVLLTKTFSLGSLIIDDADIRIPELPTPLQFKHLYFSGENNPLTFLQIHQANLLFPTMNFKLQGNYAWTPSQSTNLEVNLTHIPPVGSKNPAEVSHFQLTGNPSELSLKALMKQPVPATFTLDFIEKNGATTLSVRDALGTWNKQSLSASLGLTRTPNNTQIAPSFIRLGNNTLSLQGRIAPTWDLQWKTEFKALSELSPLLDGKLQGQGKVTGPALLARLSGELKGENFYIANQIVKKLQVSAVGTLATHQFTFEANGAEWQVQAKVNGRYDQKQWQGDWQQLALTLANTSKWLLPRPSEIHFTQSELSLSPLCLKQSSQALCLRALWTRASDKIDIRLSATMSSLQWLEKVYTGLKNIQGSARAAINIIGSRLQPAVTGEMRVKNASLNVPHYGLHLTNIHLDANSRQQGLWLYKGGLLSDKQALTVNGRVDFSKPDHPGEMQITGNKVPIMQTSEYKIWASPALKFSHTSQLLRLQGSITIPKAMIAPRDFSSTVELPPELVDVNAPKEEQREAKLWPMTSNIKLILGDDVNISVIGLQGKVLGNLTIVDEPNRLATALGSLRVVNGTYQAYSQKLDIDSGTLSYTGGPLGNPGLNVRAHKTIITTSDLSTIPQSFTPADVARIITLQTKTQTATIVVGVNVTGLLKNPIIRLYSEPATLSQSEILSYIILGRALNQASGQNDSQALLNGLMALNLTTENSAGILHELQTKIGLDQIEVKTLPVYDQKSQSLQESTSIFLGKALSPRLFLSYSYGLLYSVNTFYLRYQLSKKLSVQTEASSKGDGGFDLLYTIETN